MAGHTGNLTGDKIKDTYIHLIVNTTDGLQRGDVGAITELTDGRLLKYESTGNKIINTVGLYEDASGNVGINETSPSYLLHITKDQNAATILEIQNQNAGASAYAGIVLDADGNDSIIYAPSSGYATTDFQNKLILQNSTGIINNSPISQYRSATASRPLLYITNENADSNSGILYFQKLSASPADDDLIGQIRFQGYDSGSNETNYGSIYVTSSDVTDGDEAGKFMLYVAINAVQRELFTINGYNGIVDQGEIIFNNVQEDMDFIVKSSGDATALVVDGSTGIVKMLSVYSHDMNGETIRDLQINNSGELGYDSSARKGKTKIESMGDTSWLYKLKPVIYESKKRNTKTGKYLSTGTGIKQYGLIAEDVEKIKRSFVFYDIDGNKKEIAGVHYKKFIPVLINEIIALNERIKKLEN